MRQLTYDWYGDPSDPPLEGDHLQTRRGTVYRILDARVVKRRHPTPEFVRYSYVVDRIDPATIEGAVMFDLVWNPRGRRG